MSRIAKYKNILYVTTCLSSIYLANIANALPEGYQVQAGSAEFSQTGNELHIKTSDKVVINWKNHDIDKGELVNYIQPSSSSIALNRIISQNPTKIDGTLRANGNIIIINQNGILFGKGAVVDVNGLIASTADIDTDHFMKSTTKFEFNKPGNADAIIINEGKISVKEAGLIGFVAPQMINDGVIIANKGSVVLASGETFTLDMYGDKIIEVAVSDTLKKQLIANNNLIEANGGKIILTAAAGKEIIDSLIEVKGELKAASVKEKNGEIIIFAEGSTAVKGNITENKGVKKGTSKVEISGKVDASGTNPGEKGGKILVLGDDITLKKGSIIIASGYEGKDNTTLGKEKSAYREGSAGGDIRIGGDYLGKGDTPTANNLTMENFALIINDSLNTGDAGRTILWSDNETKFNGFILARAFGGKKRKFDTLDPQEGGNAGNGGFVETSGHNHLDSTGIAFLTASNGDRGTHLLDPDNITLYGNVTPDYQSSDYTIDLSTALKVHLDSSSKSSMLLQYVDSTAIATNNGDGTLNTTRPDLLQVGMQIRLAADSLSDTADVINSDTYKITAISNITGNVTTSPVIPEGVYSEDVPIYIGYVSSWTNSADNSNNASADDTTKMPLYLVNTLNDNPVLQFDGSNNALNINLSFMNDESFGYNGNPHTNFYTAKTTTYGRLYSTTTSGGDSYEGFSTGGDYTMDYLNGGDYLSYFVSSGSVTPSSAYNSDGFNILTYEWLPDSPGGAPYAQNTRSVYANSNQEVYAYLAGTIGPYGAPSTIGGVDSNYWGGQLPEVMMYQAMLGPSTINLLSQYSSAKWNLALVPPGSGGTEASRAMDSTTGYSIFTTRYLERLTNSADINLTATSNFNFDLKSDTLTLADDANFTINAGSITSSSAGSIVTNYQSAGGNISFTTTDGNIDISNISVNAQNGATITYTVPASRTISFNSNTTASADNNISLNIGSSARGEGTITISGITANNKTYDTNTIATFSGTATTNYGTLSGTPTGTFSNKNVGSNKPLELSGLIITASETDSTNRYKYHIPAYTADITNASLSVTGLTAHNKTYDATTTATVSGTAIITPLGSDSVSVTGTPIGTFADKNVGTAKSVTISGLSLSGSDSNNYTIVSAEHSASITRAPVVIVANNISVTYPTSNAPFTYQSSGKIGSEIINFTGSLTRNSGNGVGSYDIVEGNLEATGNYQITDFTKGKFTILAPTASTITSSIPSTSVIASITSGSMVSLSSTNLSSFISVNTSGSDNITLPSSQNTTLVQSPFISDSHPSLTNAFSPSSSVVSSALPLVSLR